MEKLCEAVWATTAHYLENSQIFVGGIPFAKNVAADGPPTVRNSFLGAAKRGKTQEGSTSSS